MLHASKHSTEKEVDIQEKKPLFSLYKFNQYALKFEACLFKYTSPNTI